MLTIQDVAQETNRRSKDALVIDGSDALFFENHLKSRQNVCVSKATNTGITKIALSVSGILQLTYRCCNKQASKMMNTIRKGRITLM